VISNGLWNFNSADGSTTVKPQSAAEELPGRSAGLWRSRLHWIVYALAWWTGLVLIFSTRSEISGQPVTGSEAFKAAAARWYVWAVLSYFIIQVDKRLPIRQDAIWKRLLFHIPISCVFIAAYTYLNYWACIFLEGPIDLAVSSADGTVEALTRALVRPSNLVYWVILSTHRVMTYEQEKKQQELKTARLEVLFADARLATLRSQLHPHFLFNSLNAISAYIEIAPRVAIQMLAQLSDLLRMSLQHHEAQEIPIREEFTFLTKYLGLQQLRFEDRLEIDIRMDPAVASALVPTFILQPLVENAILHGIAVRNEKGLIEVNAWRNKGDLCISVRDDGPGLPAGWTVQNGSGTGLKNTQDRLETLYGKNGRQRLDIRNEPGRGVLVNLCLPFHVEARR
jgi:two-component system, LytTR family, sensor kinase